MVDGPGIHHRLRRALTTAAGLWLVGAIGMSAGGGMYVVAVFATVLGLLALGVMRRFEDKESALSVCRLQVVLEQDAEWTDVESRLDRAGARWEMRGLEVDRGAGSRRAEFNLFLPSNAATTKVITELDQVAGLRTASIEARDR